MYCASCSRCEIQGETALESYLGDLLDTKGYGELGEAERKDGVYRRAVELHPGLELVYERRPVSATACDWQTGEELHVYEATEDKPLPCDGDYCRARVEYPETVELVGYGDNKEEDMVLASASSKFYRDPWMDGYGEPAPEMLEPDLDMMLAEAQIRAPEYEIRAEFRKYREELEQEALPPIEQLGLPDLPPAAYTDFEPPERYVLEPVLVPEVGPQSEYGRRR